MAHSGAMGVVKKRMDAMSAIGKAMKSIAAMVKGDTRFEPVSLHAAAHTIRKHSGENLTRLFPQGSTDTPSQAKLEIWQDWDNFAAMAERLNEQAVRLETLETILTPADFGKLAGTCKGCHERFRARKS